ncbi:MAG TPA: alpha/beta hydrolase [Thermoanaerobaculia bacterium]|nr:alpha/beta hydrolase [Thermoanaerobaculia bacterium]
MDGTTSFTLPAPGGGEIHGLIDLPEGHGLRPAVIICHGFKGFMEWGFFPSLATLLCERGFVAVRFNFRGAGMLPGDELVSDARAFRDDTHSGELADLLAVLAAAAGEGRSIAPDHIDRGKLGLFGHSRGGAAAVLAAAHPSWRDRLCALVTWAAISRVDRYTPEQKRAWRKDGELPVVNARTGQRLAMGVGLLDDLEACAAELDVLAAAGRHHLPWLIVHGTDDESVPAAEGAELARQAASQHELLLIPGASHTFGSRHPFAGPTPHLIQALNATQTWFRRHL